MRRLKPFQPVVVEWEDSFTAAGAQHSSPSEALAAYKPTIRRSIGYWIGRTDAVVCFATEDDRSEDFKNDVGGISYVPAGMVRSIELVCSLPTRRRKRR